MAGRKWRATKLCADCQARKARFAYRGRVKADRDHVLCFQCWRGEMNRSRARQLAFAWPGPTELTSRQIAHRERMLSHLRRGV